eukprot:TRINITY_DN23108_c0_g1_i2.p1 TRINITY_DN23108_c0_g1~~TRINITY_DN23108_c0_g1_i2.p1  ORF type:complete len:381 (+),score=48.66 TRINITY_DN23108_c0_g1_i2:125-1267(+)
MFMLFGFGQGQDHQRHELLYHKLKRLQRGLKAAVDVGLQNGEMVQWPVEAALIRFGEKVKMLTSQYKVAEETWTKFDAPSNKDITDEQHFAALSDIASILHERSLEWWPCRGTLIALLRHGSRSGALADGRVDVVDFDVDVMVGVQSEESWMQERAYIRDGLIARGWDDCLARTSVDAPYGSDALLRSRQDLVLCVRHEPPMVLDITSYITGPDTGGSVHVQEFCGRKPKLGSGPRQPTCEVPHNIGVFRSMKGRLRKAAIHPMGHCRAGHISVPCPRRPMETLQAMFHLTNVTATCMALPDVAARQNRDLPSDKREAWQSQGLSLRDVEVLRNRSAELEAAGFMSMAPYFDSEVCREQMRHSTMRALSSRRMSRPHSAK